MQELYLLMIVMPKEIGLVILELLTGLGKLMMVVQLPEELGQMELNDFFVKNGKIEANGLMSHDMYLAKVKTPDQSKSDWDLLDIVSTIPAEKAYIPVAESSCSLVKQ